MERDYGKEIDALREEVEALRHLLSGTSSTEDAKVAQAAKAGPRDGGPCAKDEKYARRPGADGVDGSHGKQLRGGRDNRAGYLFGRFCLRRPAVVLDQERRTHR